MSIAAGLTTFFANVLQTSQNLGEGYNVEDMAAICALGGMNQQHLVG